MRTAARDASTRAAAALRSGFRSTASATSAVSSGSPKLRIQFGTTVPLRCESGPASRDLCASRLRHDVRAKGRMFQSAAGKHEAAGGNKKQGAAPSVHSFDPSGRRRERRDV